MKDTGSYAKFRPGFHLGRRTFLGGAGALAAGLLLPLPAAAQAAGGRIHRLEGEVLVNGRRAARDAIIAAGDRLRTGRDGRLAFTLNGDAFFLRASSELQLERNPASAALIDGLRLLSGALGATFARGRPRKVHARTLTIGIRGTGVYVETRKGETYACTCFGATDLESGGSMMERVLVVAAHHQARTVYDEPRDGRRVHEASFVNHSNEEMAGLEAYAGRPDPFARR